jgi:hypothetical protein
MSFQRRRPAHLATALGVALSAVLLAGCSGGGTDGGGDGGDDGGDAAAYDTETLMPAIQEAVEGEEAVHLAVGDKTPPADINLDMTWGETDDFRALVGADPGQALDVRKVGGRVYVGGAAVGEQWGYLELDDPKLSGAEGFNAGVVGVLLDTEVPGSLEALAQGVTGVESSGAEEVGGVPTTHYVLTVDSGAWLEALPKSSIFRQMKVDPTVEMDMYVDEEARPVRWEYDGPAGADGGTPDSARIDFTEWGTPVEVEEPQDAVNAG